MTELYRPLHAVTPRVSEMGVKRGLSGDDELRASIYAAFGTIEAQVDGFFGGYYLRAEAEHIAEREAWRVFLLWTATSQ